MLKGIWYKAGRDTQKVEIDYNGKVLTGDMGGTSRIRLIWQSWDWRK